MQPFMRKIGAAILEPEILAVTIAVSRQGRPLFAFARVAAQKANE